MSPFICFDLPSTRTGLSFFLLNEIFADFSTVIDSFFYWPYLPFTASTTSFIVQLYISILQLYLIVLILVLQNAFKVLGSRGHGLCLFCALLISVSLLEDNLWLTEFWWKAMWAFLSRSLPMIAKQYLSLDNLPPTAVLIMVSCNCKCHFQKKKNRYRFMLGRG